MIVADDPMTEWRVRLKRPSSSGAEHALDKRATGVRFSPWPPVYEWDADYREVCARLAERGRVADVESAPIS